MRTVRCSACRGVRGVCPRAMLARGRGCLPKGDVCPEGCLPRGVSVQGGPAQGGVFRGVSSGGCLPRMGCVSQHALRGLSDQGSFWSGDVGQGVYGQGGVWPGGCLARGMSAWGVSAQWVYVLGVSVQGVSAHRGVYPIMHWFRHLPSVDRILDTRVWKHYPSATTLRTVIRESN